MPSEVIAVFGPTASGKTAVAEALADALGTEVVSTDAMQVYAGLPILTNQPDRPTRLVAVWQLSHEGSVGEFQDLAHAAIDDLVATAGTAVVAGGTGLYLRAALAELDLPPAPEEGARARWEAAYDEDADAAFAELERRDPTAAALVHRNDRRRVVRALELAEAGASLAPTESRLWSGETRRPTLVVGLDVPKAVLDQRIDERTDEMFRRGVVDEVRAALRNGRVSRTAAKTLGLTEISELPADEARERIALRTRRYAAYQRKWMRRIPGIVVIDAGSASPRPPADVAGEILRVAQSR
jgi:tRNA dimethylallyltransferase